MQSYEPQWLLFASDSARLALVGGAFILVAAFAVIMDRRRHRRDRVQAADRVGWVPWTTLYLLSAVLGLGLIAAALTH